MVALVSVAAATARTVRGGEVAALSEVVPAETAEVAEVESVGAVEVLGHQPLGVVAGGAVWPLLSAEGSDALAPVSGAGLL